MTQVADAIFETALPRFAGDSLPKTDAGVALAVADRYLICQLEICYPPYLVY